MANNQNQPSQGDFYNLYNNKNVGNSSASSAASSAASTSSNNNVNRHHPYLATINSAKVIEQLMVSSTTPIYLKSQVIGTGFFYRNLNHAYDNATDNFLADLHQNQQNDVDRPKLEIQPATIKQSFHFQGFLFGLRDIARFVIDWIRLKFNENSFWHPVLAFFSIGSGPQSSSLGEVATIPLVDSQISQTNGLTSIYLITAKTNLTSRSIKQGDELSFTYQTPSLMSLVNKDGDRFVCSGSFNISDVLEHPTENLAAIDVSRALPHDAVEEICCLTSDNIRDDDFLSERFGVAERVTLFGFCFDFCSDGEHTWQENHGIARSGFTAYPPGRHFQGRPHGVVNMISYSGYDTGAPIMMRSSANDQSPSSAACFLGILCDWQLAESLTEEPSSTTMRRMAAHRSERMILGRYIKASQLLGTDTWLPLLCSPSPPVIINTLPQFLNEEST